MSRATPKCSTHVTKVEIGTLYKDALTNSILVHNGESWQSMSMYTDDIAEFENKFKHIHEKHPTLQAAWDEYRSLRKLIMGEEE